jgi:hypothetical protein
MRHWELPPEAPITAGEKYNSNAYNIVGISKGCNRTESAWAIFLVTRVEGVKVGFSVMGICSFSVKDSPAESRSQEAKWM